MITGTIILWAGAVVDIPAGFVLCDGNNGTPDLRDKVPVGAGSTYAVGATGGNATHTHGFTSSNHNHTIQTGKDVAASGVDYNVNTGNSTVSGTTNTGSSMQPYHALCYIMKT